MSARYDNIVIGAGPGGIVCMKELVEQGANALCLERGDSMGGTFDRTYDNLVLTSSAVMSMYSDFWIGDEHVQSMWTKAEALDYWQRYAAHFGVTERVRYGTEVMEVRRDDKGWTVDTNGESFQCTRLVMATGNNRLPRMPAWSQQVDRQSVALSHSMTYKNAQPFSGKRVVVVGGGESGTDIALEIAMVASHCWVSLRRATGWVTPRKRGELPADIATHRGLWALPRDYGRQLTPALVELETSRHHPHSDAAVLLNKMVENPLGVFGTYGTKSFALPIAMADHDCTLVGDIASVEQGGRTLIAQDGTKIEDVDAIILCTGYTNRVELLPGEFRDLKPRQLYKHMFHPDHGDSIAWIGWARPNFGSQFPIMEMQARLYAQVCQGAVPLPSSSAMSADIDKYASQFRRQFDYQADEIMSLVDYRVYLDDLAEVLGVTPPLWGLFFTDNLTWRKIMFGALQGTQFRFRGPGAKPVLARDILRRCLHLPLNHNLVKLGLKGRLRYLASSLRGQPAVTG